MMNYADWRRFLFPSGKVPPLLLAKDTAPLDQLHAGGLMASRRLIEAADFSGGDVVLDVGAGPGGSARLLTELRKCRVVCLDMESEYLRVSRELFQARNLYSSGFIRARAEKVPVKTGSLNGVWVQHLLGSVPHPFTVVRECFRILKPGGKLVLHECLKGDEPGNKTLYPLPFAKTAEQNYAPGYKELFQQMIALGFRPRYLQETSGEMEGWYRHRWVKLSRKQNKVLHPVYGDCFLQMVKNMGLSLKNGTLTIWESVWVKGENEK